MNSTSIITATAFLTGLISCLSIASAQAVEGSAIAPNAIALMAENGEIHSSLSLTGCDVGHEPACTPVRQRSEFVSDAEHQHGDRIRYKWDVLVPADLTYKATGGHLYATRFLSSDDSVVMKFDLDPEYGYEYSRKVCFGPEGFGEWHSVELRVVWDSTKKQGLSHKTPGEIHIFCDGVELFSRTGRPNLAEGHIVRPTFGLEGALPLAEGDNVSISYRNIEISDW